MTDTDEMTTLQRRAKELAAAFTTMDRGNPDNAPRLVTLRDGSPEWMEDACHGAHGDMFPDDWRYWMIECAADALAEGTDPEDPGTFADDHVPVYTWDRLRWLASHLSRFGYVDEAVENYGHSDQGVTGDIGLGIYAELEEVFSSLARFLEDMDDDDEEDDEE